MFPLNVIENYTSVPKWVNSKPQNWCLTRPRTPPSSSPAADQEMWLCFGFRRRRFSVPTPSLPSLLSLSLCPNQSALPSWPTVAAMTEHWQVWGSVNHSFWSSSARFLDFTWIWNETHFKFSKFLIISWNLGESGNLQIWLKMRRYWTLTSIYPTLRCFHKYLTAQRIFSVTLFGLPPPSSSSVHSFAFSCLSISPPFLVVPFDVRSTTTTTTAARFVMLPPRCRRCCQFFEGETNLWTKDVCARARLTQRDCEREETVLDPLLAWQAGHLSQL